MAISDMSVFHIMHGFLEKIRKLLLYRVSQKTNAMEIQQAVVHHQLC